MIRVQSIHIEEFRGIRDLTLNFNEKNFAVCGPNGTGKSGIVDALEFAFTGSVSRLSGEGTEGITLKAHAPHVDSRNAPEKARVTVKATIPKLSKSVTIVRSVKNPAVPVVTPNDPEIVDLINELQNHPEFVLTRREIIRYVISPPGKRSKDVQTLLKLDRVEEARAALQKFANSQDREIKKISDDREAAGAHLVRVLGIKQLNSAEILKEVNVRRALLGLPAFTELTKTTSLKDGLQGIGAKSPSSRIPKTQAISDCRALRNAFAGYENPASIAERAQAVQSLLSLANNEAWLAGAQRENFLRTGMAFIANRCPFCDTAWDPVQLRGHIEAELARFDDVAKQRESVEKLLQPISQGLLNIKTAIDNVLQYGSHIQPRPNLSLLSQFRSTIEEAHVRLTSLLPIGNAIATLNASYAPPPDAQEVIAAIEQFITNLPEPTQQDAARDYLVAGEERLVAYRDTSRALEKAKVQAALAKQISEAYSNVTTRTLDGIFKLVEKEFGEFYRDLNREDEAAFTAQLKPSFGKLAFDVDFYGRGYFPPGAYHSEGHQDSMGLCLYLALMNHLLKNDFTFAVLDDVLMSVDTGHRREVCGLLKSRFPNTQFILTTHDSVWLRHMKTVGLIHSKAAAHFRTWNVDHGPTEWDELDIWDEIGDHLEKNEVRGGAALLRNYMEYAAAELCHYLRAPVEFRGDAQMQLGELLPPAVSRLKGYYKAGKQAASSWNQKDVLAAITERDGVLSAAVKTSEMEQWQVNAAVHYNSWAQLSKEEFAPVLESYKKLLDCFRCSECKGYLYVLPERNSAPETVRCDCSMISINLVSKS